MVREISSNGAMILKKMSDGKYIGIYSCMGGFIEGLGRTLRDYYTTESAIDQIMSLGSVQSLGKTLGYTEEEYPSGLYSRFYIRDLGGEVQDYEAKIFNTLDDVKQWDPYCMYWYIFQNNKWYYTLGNKKLRVLRQHY